MWGPIMLKCEIKGEVFKVFQKLTTLLLLWLQKITNRQRKCYKWNDKEAKKKKKKKFL